MISKKHTIASIFLFGVMFIYAQKFNPKWILIPQELKENANACIVSK